MIKIALFVVSVFLVLLIGCDTQRSKKVEEEPFKCLEKLVQFNTYDGAVAVPQYQIDSISFRGKTVYVDMGRKTYITVTEIGSKIVDCVGNRK